MTEKDKLELAQHVNREIDRLVKFVDGDLAPGRPILEKSTILLGYVIGAAEAHPELRGVVCIMLEDILARLRGVDQAESERN